MLTPTDFLCFQSPAIRHDLDETLKDCREFGLAEYCARFGVLHPSRRLAHHGAVTTTLHRFNFVDVRAVYLLKRYNERTSVLAALNCAVAQAALPIDNAIIHFYRTQEGKIDAIVKHLDLSYPAASPYLDC